MGPGISRPITRLNSPAQTREKQNRVSQTDTQKENSTPMATQAQIIANQANSRKSTGPVTDEGKAKSCLNRLSHGFASSTRFIRGEDPEQFNALLTDLIHEYQPATPTQQILVEKMAHHQWITLRANRIQGDLMARMSTIGDVTRTLPLMIRYQTTAERAFHQAHAELVRAQKQPANCEIGFESQKAPESAELATEAPSKTAQASPAPTPKPPAPPAKPAKPAPPATPEAPAAPDFPSIEDELHWVMNASVAEIRASGF
jgi:hypothetical protein